MLLIFAAGDWKLDGRRWRRSWLKRVGSWCGRSAAAGRERVFVHHRTEPDILGTANDEVRPTGQTASRQWRDGQIFDVTPLVATDNLAHGVISVVSLLLFSSRIAAPFADWLKNEPNGSSAASLYTGNLGPPPFFLSFLCLCFRLRHPIASLALYYAIMSTNWNERDKEKKRKKEKKREGKIHWKRRGCLYVSIR